MAGALMGSDRPADVADRSARVDRVGVRVLGASLVTMCESGGVEAAIGDWVLVESKDMERRLGRVVVAADRWRGTLVDRPWRVVRVVTPGEMATMAPLIETVPVSAIHPEIGSTGPAPAATPDRGGLSDLSLGGEDERFRQAKGRLPTLGQLVRTAQGDGIVLVVDVTRRAVTVALTSTEFEIVVPADEVNPPFPGGPA